MTRIEREYAERAFAVTVVIVLVIAIGRTVHAPFWLGVIAGYSIERPTLILFPMFCRRGVCPIIGHDWFPTNRVGSIVPPPPAAPLLEMEAIWCCSRCLKKAPRADSHHDYGDVHAGDPLGPL